MDTIPRKSFSLLLCGLVLVCFVLGLLVAAPVQADMGVHPILPGGSSLKPEDETPIQMAAETVVMTVRPATAADNAVVQLNPQAYGLLPDTVWYPAIAEVQADFTMRNPTSEAVSLTAWFPLASTLEQVGWELNPEEIVPRIASFQVTADGNPVDYTTSELPNPKGADKPPLPWASFPVSFPAGQDTIIHVSYLLPTEPSVFGDIHMVLYYIFQTGAGWAGPIGQAELILNLPYPASVETMAGIASGTLSLPYTWGTEVEDIPAGAVLEGNQARWTWKDFEPGPEDDFSIWLIQPGKWQELQTARNAVQANPEDGQAWLDLAYVYHSLATAGYNSPSVFSASYLPLAIEAYQKVVALMPDHPAPHAGLALLYLAPYMQDKNAPPDVYQSVQDEFKTARELEEKNPDLGEPPGISSWGVEDILSMYLYNDATATAEMATWDVENATETAKATLYNDDTATAEAVNWACWATADAECTATPTQPPTATPTLEPTQTSTPIPSATPQPLPTPTPSQPGMMTGNGGSLVIIVAAGVIILVIVGYLVLKRK